MESILDGVDADVRAAAQDELLCVADSKLVLGNWFAECVMNGRSLPDFAAMLGMCTASYGQTRAIYQLLASLDHEYAHLERGRGGDQIRSMNLLDEPPQNWEDFIVSVWLAEQATWSMMSGFLGHPDRTVAGLARKVGEEAYFHFKYATGWFSIIAGSDEELARLRAAFDRRLPLAIAWFGPDGARDPLFDAGLRDASVGDIRAGFIRDVEATTGGMGMRADSVAQDPDDGWRADARRRGPLPAGLFEVIRFKDPELAR